MLYLNANEEKRLTFEVDIHGVESNDLQGYVRFMLYGVEYGFPVEMEHKKIVAFIPPLTDVVEREIEDGSVIDAKLEVFTDKHYFKPWEGEIKVGAPMGVKAKLTDDKKHKRGIKTKLVTREDKEPDPIPVEKETIEEEKVTKDDIRNMIGEVLVEVMAKKKKTPEQPKEEEIVEDCGKPHNEKPKKTKKKKVKEEAIAGWTKERLMNITKEDIYDYMKRHGTKNELIQEIVYNKALSEAGTGDLVQVFKHVVRALRKPRS